MCGMSSLITVTSIIPKTPQTPKQFLRNRCRLASNTSRGPRCVRQSRVTTFSLVGSERTSPNRPAPVSIRALPTGEGVVINVCREHGVIAGSCDFGPQGEMCEGRWLQGLARGSLGQLAHLEIAFSFTIRTFDLRSEGFAGHRVDPCVDGRDSLTTSWIELRTTTAFL